MIELVWDAGRTATVRLPNGAELTVGGRNGLAPADLAAVGLAASVMAAYVDVSRDAGHPPLGFLATTDVGVLPGRSPTVTLHAYVVSGDEIDDERFADLTARALDRSVVARLLGPALEVEWHLQVLHGCSSCGEQVQG